MKLFIVLVTFLLILQGFAINASPIAGRAFIIRDIVQEGIRRLIPSALVRIQNTPIPDLTDSASVPVIGMVDFTISKMKIGPITVGKFELITKSPSHIAAKLTGCSLSISLNWKMRQRSFPNIRGEGTATASTRGAIISVGLDVSIKNHRPHFTVHGVTGIDLGNLDVKVNGGFTGWIVNLMSNLFKGQVKNAIQKGIRDTLIELVNKELNEIVQDAEFVVPVYQNVSIDLHVEKVDFTETYVKGSLRSLFVNAKSMNIPLPETPMWPERMGQIFLSEDVFTSLGRSAFSAGILKATVNAEDVPPESPIKLDTKGLETYIPELQAKWPNRNLQVVVEAQRPPSFVINSTGLWIDFSTKLLMNVVLETGITKAFLAEFGFKGGALLKLQDFNQGRSFNLTGEIKKIDFVFKLMESYMGDVDLSRMERFFQIVVGRGMVPGFNRQLKDGVTLPVPLPEGLTLDKFVFEYNQGRFLGVGGDVHYKAPPQGLLYIQTLAKTGRKLIDRIVSHFARNLKWEKEMEVKVVKALQEAWNIPQVTV